MENNTENLLIYSQVRAVPQEAIKTIGGGRLKGKSDINPMWRIRTLTDLFGPVGFGWRYEIVKMWIEEGFENERAAFVVINLFVKQDGEWSGAIPGIGGSSFTTKEKDGIYTSDECYKMALTDAISVSCKALGVGADVYWEKDPTKYNKYTEEPKESEKNQPEDKPKKIIKKVLPKEMFCDVKIMSWIYTHEKAANEEKKRFSLYNLVEKNYIVTGDDLKTIGENYESYKIKNNL